MADPHEPTGTKKYCRKQYGIIKVTNKVYQ
jgi:hypothetical protein